MDYLLIGGLLSLGLVAVFAFETPMAVVALVTSVFAVGVVLWRRARDTP